MREHFSSHRELQVNEAGVVLANQIVKELLGTPFIVEYDLLPKSVGVMGDKGVRGYVPIISGNLENPAKYLLLHPDKIAKAADRICNETEGACRVMFDITPPPYTTTPGPGSCTL